MALQCWQRTDVSGTAIDRPLWPANPDGRIAVKAAPDRTHLGDSFLFELPPSWTQAGTLHLKAEVNPDHLPVETSYTNDTTSRAVTFLATDPIKIELLKVSYLWGAGSGSDCGRTHTPSDAG